MVLSVPSKNESARMSDGSAGWPAKGFRGRDRWRDVNAATSAGLAPIKAISPGNETRERYSRSERNRHVTFRRSYVGWVRPNSCFAKP